MSTEHFDVVVVGAGLSGIGAGYHLQTECPERTYVILEGRESIGGTWDLFRYPGVRSDSDMFTLGYSFRPWKHPKAIAEGATILSYIRDTAAMYGIDRKIRFSHRVVSASWSSADALWTVTAERGPEKTKVVFTASFFFACSGYYDYAAGYTPAFPGIERFKGRVIHPQKWTADVDYSGKRVVVIGSGATAVTLVPELAKKAAHVTMLQRSPTYVLSRPDEDALANWARDKVSDTTAYGATRWKNVLLGMFFFQLSKRRPEYVKSRILAGVRAELGPEYDVDSHFTPRYRPWDQRVCLVPNGDLFRSIREGHATVVTDTISTFTETGIELSSGATLDADLVVTATGLELKVLGGVTIEVDGAVVDFSKTIAYKGMMFSDVPNFASCFGYTNASWTLKCDLTCGYVCRLLNRMRARGYRQCTPRFDEASAERRPWMDFTSSYIQRNIANFPSQGARAPWKLHQNYALDLLSLRFGRLDDGAMEFAR
ncbi:MAG TPA: NAD(P)/FAD-dependent oxidoreductase [Polyangiaceae bacterium]|jgi:cation diffusion facilitator CzcD-associated flavoprotein CzcO|nr:NAD(P)/FAD-dependent oxidoreductase [Polyangiaceae bacterium]